MLNIVLPTRVKSSSSRAHLKEHTGAHHLLREVLVALHSTPSSVALQARDLRCCTATCLKARSPAQRTPAVAAAPVRAQIGYANLHQRKRHQLVGLQLQTSKAPTHKHEWVSFLLRQYVVVGALHRLNVSADFADTLMLSSLLLAVLLVERPNFEPSQGDTPNVHLANGTLCDKMHTKLSLGRIETMATGLAGVPGNQPGYIGTTTNEKAAEPVVRPNSVEAAPQAATMDRDKKGYEAGRDALPYIESACPPDVTYSNRNNSQPGTRERRTMGPRQARRRAWRAA